VTSKREPGTSRQQRHPSGSGGLCSPHTILLTRPPTHPFIDDSHQPNPAQESRTMATSFCAAACRLCVVAPPVTPSLRPRRGVVTVRAESGGGINPAIRKEEDKVVDTVLAGELSKPLTAYCRYAHPLTFGYLLTPHR
jgi:CDGSH iron-sulfur domain-containing protein 2